MSNGSSEEDFKKDTVRRRLTSTDTGAKTALKRTLNAVLALWIVAIVVGLILHQDMSKQELQVLKKQLPWVWFDNILKRYGTVIPILPFSARWLASALADRRRQTVAPGIHFAEAGCIYIGISIARVVIYLLHVIGILHLLLRVFMAVSHQESKQSEVMSDHLFLGASLTAILTTEAVLAYRELRQALIEQYQDLARISFLAFAVVTSSALCLGTIFDMYFTAKYFHGPLEIMGTTAVGWFLFQWPLWYWLQTQQ